MTKHIADLDKESALNRFIKEMSNNNKYVGSFKIKEIKYVDNCKVELILKESNNKKEGNSWIYSRKKNKYL